MNPPANWYPDPTGRHGQRYWDGAQWTEHVFTDGVQGVDPLEQAVAAAGEASSAEATTDELATDEAMASQDVSSEDDDEWSADEDPADSGPAHDDVTEAESASDLFDDAGGQDTWTPQDEGGGEEDATVAPDMEAADVVASLDEVGDGTSAGDAVDVDTDAPPVAGDMSDAFVLAPETASRIVKRRGAEVGDAARQAEPAVPPSGEDVSTGEDVIDAPAPAADAAPISDAPPTPDVPPTPDAPLTAEAPPAAAPPAAEAQPAAAAPPASTAGPAGASGDLGITGDLLGGAFAERSGGGPVALQNSRLLRCSVTPGDAVIARQGTMVAYQGDVSFDRQGAGGVTRAIKRAATGEGLAMMRAEGRGDVFFADGAQHVFLLQLAGGPGLSVNGRNVLAFSAALEWDIQRVKGASLLAGGLFNTTFTGTGWVALVSDGEPVVLHADDAQTHVDVNALVAWSAGLSTRIVNSASAKSLVGLGSGEAFQMAFDGPGIVIVQPSEGPLGGSAAT